MNTLTQTLTQKVLEAVIFQGVVEFCVCPGARNAALVYALANASHLSLYNWSEERSAAFFALGRIKATGRPVAVVTTSGTAAAELLPAVIEAYYTGLPLILITADRPRRFRGSGAPQAIEQVGLFTYYAESHDLADGEECCLENWSQKRPLHLNICLEEPVDSECQSIQLQEYWDRTREEKKEYSFSTDSYLKLIQSAHYPLVVVGALPPSQKEAAIHFLQHLNAPVYLEAISGLREESRLDHLKITFMEKKWEMATHYHYPIDGILRLGGVPTHRLWRDIEDRKEHLILCSVSDLPFSGLSGSEVIYASLLQFFEWAVTQPVIHDYPFSVWKAADRYMQQALQTLFQTEPLAEQSLVHALSQHIPKGSKVYLGNSLPIREWDLGATYEERKFKIACSRGANGIDGQLATFLGYSSSEQENWALLGDLTLLYDLVAPWITPQLAGMSTQLVVINNRGAGIFARMFAQPIFQNQHQYSFESFAKFWNWSYELWERVPDSIASISGARLIELRPDNQATERFLCQLRSLPYPAF